jgi:hypothetical protein
VLQDLDDARAVWLAHTAATRANAEEAEVVLAERHADDAAPEPVVTADEWLDAHRAAVADDERWWMWGDEVEDREAAADDWLDRHAEAAAAEDAGRALREVYLGAGDVDESDTGDWIDRHENAYAAAEAGRELREVYLADDDPFDDEPDERAWLADIEDDHLETAAYVLPDIRDVAAVEPRQMQEDVVRVPTAEEIEGPIELAHRALAEVRARETHEQQAEADERAAELARWHDDVRREALEIRAEVRDLHR